MCPSQNQQQRSTTSTYSPTSSTSNLAYHHPQSSSRELLKVDDAHSFMDRSMNNSADISKSNNDLTTGNQNVDTSSSSSSLPHNAVFNPAMMMMLQHQHQHQHQQQQFQADNFSAPQDATSGTFAPSDQQHQQGVDATDVSSMLFSLSNDMNNGMPSSYNHHQDQQIQQQVQQQQVNQLPPTAMVQAFQDHQLHHQGGMNPAMNTIGSSSGTINDHTGNVMSMSNNQNTTSAGNFVETHPQQQMQMQMQMQMQSMASMMPAIPPAIAQQLLIQLQQQGPSALPSIALLAGSLGNAINNNAAATQHQQQLPPAQPSSSSAAVAVASASATGAPPPPKKVGRRGDPRMHEAVRYRLTHPKCTLLDALLHGGFSFPPLHLVHISDRFVKDAYGVTLSQRKNQLMRRLRVIEKGEESNDANNKKKKVSSKKKKKKNEEADNVKSTTNSSDDTSKSGDDASSDSNCSGNVGIDAPAVPSSSVALPPQQVQVPAMPDTTAVMVPSLPTSSSEGQGQGSEMEQQIRNQLLINQLKMVLLQQQIQEQAQAQAQNQQRDQQQQQQQMNADETLMSLQTDTSAQTEERAADERNAKSA